MGQAIAAAVNKTPEFELLGIWSRGEDLDSLVSAADVVIDFSLPGGTERVLDAVSRFRVPLVCGVSGLTAEQMTKLEQTAILLPLVHDRNMSLGIAVLERAVRAAAASLGEDFAIEIAETHHLQKKDAPSGTALKLAEVIAAERGEAGTGGITFEVQRRGEVPGEHEVVMRSATEMLSFSHSVTTRDVFVAGALRAARWVIRQPAGRYGMQDVLFADEDQSQELS